jgi:hypothetical protein
MAIQEYVRSIAATQTVSKEEVLRFLEMQFARADRNHDGLLDIDLVGGRKSQLGRGSLLQRFLFFVDLQRHDAQLLLLHGPGHARAGNHAPLGSMPTHRPRSSSMRPSATRLMP